MMGGGQFCLRSTEESISIEIPLRLNDKWIIYMLSFKVDLQKSYFAGFTFDENMLFIYKF